MSWRPFQFFESTPIQDPSLGSDEPLYSDPTLTAICATPDYIVMSSHNSLIKFIDKDFKLVRSFQSYEKGWNVTFMSHLEGTDIFGTVAERQGQPAMLKLWHINKLLTRDISKITDASYHTIVHIKNGNNAYPITTFTHSSNFGVLAFGFANGIVVLVRGDLLRDRGSSQTVVYKSQDPITGLQLEKGNNYDPVLFVSTTSQVFTVSTTGANHNNPERVLDKTRGADLQTVEIVDQNLLVGRPEGLSYYSATGSSYTISLDMPKKRIFKFEKYVLIVTSNTTNSSSLIFNGYAEPTKIVIADIEHKLISFTQTMTTTVAHIISAWGDIYILSSDGVLFKIHEKNLEEQLEIVVKRELYPIAIQLAEGQADPKALLQIKKKYGDYLYDKGETTEAMDQYIASLSLGKTSETIKKYKDSKEVGNLSRFLEEMVNKGLATKEHITLLLCTYCKLKDVDKLDAFIEKYDQNENDVVQIDFDLDIVVELCRETNFLEQASKLSQSLKHSSLAVDILLRDLNDASEAVGYIKTLPIDETLRILVEYAGLLLTALPNETTALLIDVFTGKYEPDKRVNQQKSSTNSDHDTTPVLLQSYKAFVNYMSSTANSIKVSSAEDEVLNGKNTPNNRDANAIENGIKPTEPTYQPPRPRIIFPSFVSRPNEFVIFLEACVENFDKFEVDEKDKKDIMYTLYEMYLTIGNDSDDLEAKASWEKMALDLVKSNDDLLDSSSILFISNIFGFVEGEVLSHEGPGFEIDLFRSCVATRDVQGATKVLEKYGELEPELYPLALMFYTSNDSVFNEVGEDAFRNVLTNITKKRILSPLEVIQALSVNKVATFDLVKDYIIEFVEREKKEIEINEKLIESYRAEALTKKNLIGKLESDPKTIQPTTCEICSNKLDTDVVHFLCNHSYHKHCLVEEDKCPECTPARQSIHNIRQTEKAIGERYDLFEAALQDSEHRFKVVTDFFGKGAMEGVDYKLAGDAI